METLTFKTNIKCGACVAKVTPGLDALEGVAKWSVDLTSPQRVLTVEADGATPEAIQEALAGAGYKGEKI
ncbi:heavy-metal-associated domain-containing protein [Arsenicibacter rosenii]|uniref:HMA domain-containing protein n=1 Tax=Arsenicibacter rosenii TaxID=1750698 RepID=A0A1S2VE53_9BACT|nr:heavy-metal-associated domain-containing protein [Arsenicibacter rosenii]OIN56982.1 hypothetical protein BLX24_21745 [Arsenicibacter rosenii]